MLTISCILSDASYEMPTIRCLLSDANYQMPTIRCQLSDDYYQIPTIRCQPSDAYYQMPTIMPTILLKYGYLVLMSYRGCCQNPISPIWQCCGICVIRIWSLHTYRMLTKCKQDPYLTKWWQPKTKPHVTTDANYICLLSRLSDGNYQ